MNWLNWQIDYLLYLQNFREISCHIFDKFFLIMTMFGEVYIPIMLISFIYWCINKRTGVYILWSYLFGFLMNTIIKVTACIYRPWILDARIKPVADAIPAATGYSFPSGHTTSCVTTYGGVMVPYWKNKIIRYLAPIIIILVMFSRNYLGVHTPQDVIVSLIMCIIILYANKKLLDWESAGKNRDSIIVGVVTVLSLLFILYVNYKSYPMDYLDGKLLYDTTPMKIENTSRVGFVFGVFWGWIIEKRFVGFMPELGSKLNKLFRFLIGFITMLVLLCLSNLFLVDLFGEKYGLLMGYLILGLYITLLYPFLCKHVAK